MSPPPPELLSAVPTEGSFVTTLGTTMGLVLASAVPGPGPGVITVVSVVTVVIVSPCEFVVVTIELTGSVAAEVS